MRVEDQCCHRVCVSVGYTQLGEVWEPQASLTERKESMELEDIERRKSALATILRQMDVPENNMDFHGERGRRNLQWVLRNLGVRNREHPMFQTAMTITKEILKNI